jgi:glycerol kinase
VDLWKSRDELAAHWKAERRFEPRMSPSDRETRMSRWREAVARSRKWATA